MLAASRGRAWKSAATAANPPFISVPPAGERRGSVSGGPPPGLRGTAARRGIFDPALFDSAADGSTPSPFPGHPARGRAGGDRRPHRLPLRTWPPGPGPRPLGLVFIDGGHAFETVRRLPLLVAAPRGRRISADSRHVRDPADGGQAPFQVYRTAAESGKLQNCPGPSRWGCCTQVIFSPGQPDALCLAESTEVMLGSRFVDVLPHRPRGFCPARVEQAAEPAGRPRALHHVPDQQPVVGRPMGSSRCGPTRHLSHQ